MLAAVAGGGYWFWTTTPLYALQETMLAAQNHDASTFDRRVWTASVVDNLLEDVIVYPALSTPGLSDFQRQVAAGAVTMVKIQTGRDIVNAINKNLNSPVPYGDSSCAPMLMQPAYAQTGQIEQSGTTGQTIQNAAAEKTSPRDLLNVVSRELGGEVSKLKTEAYQRMEKYVRSHPQTVPGRIANASAGERGLVVRRILEDHGISQNYFKGLTGYKVRDIASASGDELRGLNANFAMSGPFQVAYVGLKFFSPVIDNEILVEIELVKSSAETGNEWKVRRLSNLRPVLNTVALDYLTDVHELIAYSLAGMNNRNMASDMRGMTERIKQDPKAHSVLQKLGF